VGTTDRSRRRRTTVTELRNTRPHHLEAVVPEFMAARHPGLPDALRQVDVTEREYTGYGSFTNMRAAGVVTSDNRWIDGPCNT